MSGLSFLAAPQSSDQQVEQTGANFRQGVELGHKDAVAAQDRVDAAAAAVTDAQTKASAANAKLAQATIDHGREAATAAGVVTLANVRASNDKLKEDARKVLVDPGSPPTAIDAAKDAIVRATGNIDTIDSNSGKWISDVATTGKPLTVPPALLPFAPPDEQASEFQKQAYVAKGQSAIQNAREGAIKLNAPPKEPKIGETSQSAVANFSSAVQVHPKLRSDLASMQEFKDSLPPEKIFNATAPGPIVDGEPTFGAMVPNPKYDPSAVKAAQRRIDEANAAIAKNATIIRSGYAGVVKRVQSGELGADQKDAFNEVTRGSNLDLSDVGTHPAVKQAVNAIITSLKNKQGLFGLTSAEQQRMEAFTKLGNTLSLNQDPAGILAPRPAPFLPQPTNSTAPAASDDGATEDTTDDASESDTGGTP